MKTFFKYAFLGVFVIISGCGGGGDTTYKVQFDGTVSGLTTGQTITLVGSLPTTGQSTNINITGNGQFSSSIELASGFNLQNAGNATVVVSKQPSTGHCTASFVSSASITVVCSSTAAGLYVGTFGTSPGYGQMLVMNDGSYWFWVGKTNLTTNVTTYTAMIYGSTGTSSNGIYSSTNGVDLFSSPQITNTTISSNYVSGTSISGTLIEGGSSGNMNLNVVPISSYQFSATPSLVLIAGTYSLTLVEKGATNAVTVTISDSGLFSGTTSTGCTFTGSATPKTSGENAYSVVINFGGSPCVLANTATTGIGVLKITSLGTQFIGGVLNQTKTNGMMIIGTKN